jgi:hypothetical protein
LKKKTTIISFAVALASLVAKAKWGYGFSGGR